MRQTQLVFNLKFQSTIIIVTVENKTVRTVEDQGDGKNGKE